MEPVLPTLSNASEVPEPLAGLRDRNATGVRDGKGFFQYTEAEALAWEEIYRRNVWIVRNSIQEALLGQQDKVR
jgi:3-hydroxybutyryl-CoA dehydrogenase